MVNSASSELLNPTSFNQDLLFPKSASVISISFVVAGSILCLWQVIPTLEKLTRNHAIASVTSPLSSAVYGVIFLLFDCLFDTPCSSVVYVVLGIAAAFSLVSKQLVYIGAVDAVVPVDYAPKWPERVNAFEYVMAAAFFVLHVAAGGLSGGSRDYFGSCLFDSISQTLIVSLAFNCVFGFWTCFAYILKCRRDPLLAVKGIRLVVHQQVLSLVALEKLASLIVVIILSLAMSENNSKSHYAYVICFNLLLAITSYISMRISVLCCKLYKDAPTAFRRADRQRTSSSNAPSDSSGTDLSFIDLAKQTRIIQLTSLAALIGMIALAVTSIHATLGIQKLENVRINLAGRQRMLSQRLVLECYETVYNIQVNHQNSTTASTNRIKATLSLIKSSDEALLSGNELLNLTASETDIVMLRKFDILHPNFFQLTGSVSAFLMAIESTAFVDINFHNVDLANLLISMTDIRGRVLKLLDDVTGAYELRSNSRYKLMIIIQGLVFAGTMITILIQMSILIKPNFKPKGTDSSPSDSGNKGPVPTPSKSLTISRTH